ncbi:MAG: UDP-2,3-diacylglucosamine diphosphatase [Burkholderiales bacterium]|nr:UDP-2,3-diacylglucosamine diphosphatase [Burkholderiales bacterium]
MKLAFISDLHLSPETPENNQILFNLLTSWQQNLDGLYILGDFFDYYLGDDDNNEFMLSIKKAFREFTKHVPIYFIGGNHDFGIGPIFEKETKIRFIRDLTTIKVGTNTILLSHGDAFCTLDIKYQRMKKILQNPLLMYILRKTPLSWRYKLKDTLEKKSAKAFNSMPQDTYHVVDNTIIEFAKQKQANIVIHGHTHKPGRYLIEANNLTIQRYEIPDWADRPGGGHIMLEDDTFQIVM